MPFGAFAPLPLRLGGSATEGWAPERHARFCADLVAVKRTAPLARLTLTQDSGTPFASTITHYFAQNGAGLLYAPTVTVLGSGRVKLTWPAYWTDEHGIQYPVKIRQAIAQPTGTVETFPVVEISGRDVTIRSYTSADAPVFTAVNVALRLW